MGRGVGKVPTQADFISPRNEGPLESGSAFPLLKREKVDIKSGSFSNTVKAFVPSTPDRSLLPSRLVH